jgi:hypothetical protein
VRLFKSGVLRIVFGLKRGEVIGGWRMLQNGRLNN